MATRTKFLKQLDDMQALLGRLGDKAASDTRLQLGSVYCTGVSKTGKGATCGVLLATGSVVTVEGSTRHTAQEVAQFTETLAAGVK